MSIRKKLLAWMDFQRFSRNAHLDEVIEQTTEEAGQELSEEELEQVAAAARGNYGSKIRSVSEKLADSSKEDK